MENQFPLPNQIHAQYSFLSDLDGHHRIVQDLDQSVLLYSTTHHLQLTLYEVSQILTTRYGGNAANWRIRSVPRGFLIYPPIWLYRDEFNLDSHYWGTKGFIPQPWQTLNRSDPLPQMHRVHLTILDFPIDYWHPHYFRQALISVGKVSSIHRDCITGEDSTALRLWIDTPHTNLIPHKLYLGLQENWTECTILMEG